MSSRSAESQLYRLKASVCQLLAQITETDEVLVDSPQSIEFRARLCEFRDHLEEVLSVRS